MKFGRPDPEDLSVLWESPLLPLDIVLHADRSSPYYDSGDKRTVYFAESKALVHFLLTDPQMTQEKSLDRYVGLVEGGADSLDAARQVFGDLTQLQNRLESYIKQPASAPSSDIVASLGTESPASAKTLTPAEAAARIGDFELSRKRLDDAQSKLENAIMLDPSLAAAEESLGFVLLQESELEDAEKHFDRAAELDPKDAMTYYGQGLAGDGQGRRRSAFPWSHRRISRKPSRSTPNLLPRGLTWHRFMGDSPTRCRRLWSRHNTPQPLRPAKAVINTRLRKFSTGWDKEAQCEQGGRRTTEILKRLSRSQQSRRHHRPQYSGVVTQHARPAE